MKQLRPYIHEVFRCYDDEGPIQVVDEGPKRLLYFGTGVEQSVILRDAPQRLTNHYTQAMLLGLLFCPQPSTILLLGLGGGCLAQALLQALPDSHLTAVERRARVIEVAQRYFQLPTTPRLQLLCQDALTYLATHPAPVDWILGDLYHAEGMEPRQGQRRFLRDCQQALTPRGVLALNLWSRDQRAIQQITQQLKTLFTGPVLLLAVSGGNTIVLALQARAPRLGKSQWLTQARALGKQLELPLGQLAAGLRVL